MPVLRAVHGGHRIRIFGIYVLEVSDLFHDVRGFQILPGVDVFLPVREAQPHLGDVIGRSALRSLSVIGREVTGGPEDEESGSVIGIVAFLGRNRRHDVAPLEYFGRAELQLPEVNPYLGAVLHGPPLDVERLGDGVDGIPAGISVEGDEFRYFGELLRYGSYFPVFAAQKRIHVVGDQIAEGCEVGRVVKRRFGILPLQPFAFAALHVVLLRPELKRIFVTSGRVVELGPHIGHDLEFPPFVHDIGAAGEIRGFEKIEGQPDIVVAHEDISDNGVRCDRSVENYFAGGVVYRHFVGICDLYLHRHETKVAMPGTLCKISAIKINPAITKAGFW